jgi:predicted dithiol-disulfide oxidoreductase (DUF899 family)
MALPEIVSRAEWLQARTELLEREKQLTRQRDALSADRRRLPMVEITKDYRFEGPDGAAALLDLFDGRRQLIVVHFMFHPDWDEGCSSCTAGADEIAEGLRSHLAVRDTTLAYVSRAPLAKLDRYKTQRGWTFPWYSSLDSDFNYDFDVTLDRSRGDVAYNYRSAAEHEAHGTGYYVAEDASGENPGLSCFLRDGDRVFHTYSTYARGMEWTGGSYAFLDLTALGRQEAWEEPTGRADLARAAQPDFAD